MGDTEHEQEIEYLSYESQRGEGEIYEIVGMSQYTVPEVMIWLIESSETFNHIAELILVIASLPWDEVHGARQGETNSARLNCKSRPRWTVDRTFLGLCLPRTAAVGSGAPKVAAPCTVITGCAL